MPSISSFKQVQHSVAVLFFSKLFQSIFARYVLISLYLPLLKFFYMYSLLLRSIYIVYIVYVVGKTSSS